MDNTPSRKLVLEILLSAWNYNSLRIARLRRLTKGTMILEFKEFLDKGDPEIKTWFLVDTYFWPPFLCLTYAIFASKVGPALMENKKPFELRNIMVVFNMVLVLSYLNSIFGILYYTVIYNLYPAYCQYTVILKDTPFYHVVRYAYVIYMLKYVEFFDTVFFILRKKHHHISNLHIIHHTFLPLICWLCCRIEFSGYQIVPAVINGANHVIMYSYYGLAAMGPNVQKHLWWKKYLTMMQMVQFVTIIIFSCMIVPLSGCQTSKYGLYMNFFFASLILILFYNFYIKTYSNSAALTPKMQNSM